MEAALKKGDPTIIRRRGENLLSKAKGILRDGLRNQKKKKRKNVESLEGFLWAVFRVVKETSLKHDREKRRW